MKHGLLGALFFCGCTQGTTPDCTMFMCGPDLDGSSVDAGDASASDAPSDASDAADAGSDVADAAQDSPQG